MRVEFKATKEKVNPPIMGGRFYKGVFKENPAHTTLAYVAHVAGWRPTNETGTVALFEAFTVIGHCSVEYLKDAYWLEEISHDNITITVEA